MKSIVTIGEAVVNFICAEQGAALKNAQSFTKARGGAPANVAAAIAALGGSAKMIGRVGRDAFGDFFAAELKSAGVDTSLIRRSDKANTPVAFAAYDGCGKRDYIIYHEYGAERFITPNMVKEEYFKNCAALYFGSLGLCGESSRKAHRRAIEYARKSGALIAFDPNLRPVRGISTNELRENVSHFLPLTDIIKLSESELAEISGTGSAEKACSLLTALGCKCIVITKNGDGAELILGNRRRINIRTEGEAHLSPGSGDGFFGAFLFAVTQKKITRNTLESMSDELCAELLRFSFGYAAYGASIIGV